MARPVKNYCDYFPHDRDMRNHRKIKAVRTKFGISGYAIWCMTLEYLTGIDGNVIEFSDTELELMSGDYGVSATEIRDVLNYCIKLELLFLKDGFLNSESLDERLKPVYDKRGVSKSNSKKQSRSNGKYVSNNTVNAVVSVAEMPQSKVNKSKVEENNKRPIGPIDFLNKMRDRYLVSNTIYSASDEDFSAMFEIFEFIRGQTKIKSRLYELSFDEEQELQTIWDKWVPIITKKYSKKSLTEIAKFKKTEISNWTKEGLIENKPKSERNGHDKGDKFNDDFTEVIFSDGTTQKLNADQSAQAKHGLINAKAIVKGIYN